MSKPPTTHQGLVGKSRGETTITNLNDLATYARLANELIEKADKDQLADVSRLLTMNVGYDHEKYGNIPQEELLRLVRVKTLDERTQRLLQQGMQNLVSALVEVMAI